MADQNTIRVQTVDGKLWDIPSAKLPDAQKRGAKVYTAPTSPQQGSDSAISRLGSGIKAGVQPFIPSIPKTAEDFARLAVNAVEPLAGAAESAYGGFKKAREESQPIYSSVASGAGSLIGLDPEGIRQRAGKGDIAGIVGEAIPSIALTLAGGEMGKVAGKVKELAKGPVRSVLGVGKTFEQRIAGEHETALVNYNSEMKRIQAENVRALAEGRQSHEATVANIEKQNAEALAKHREKVQGIRDKYAAQVGEKEAATPVVSATQSAAAAKGSALGDSPRSGPVFRRLQGMTNQVYGMIDNLQDRIRSEYNKRWRAFDGAVGDRQVDWTPVQQAVKDAEENILKGSPESIAIFRNIMKESPQLDQASVFKGNQATEAAQNLKEVLNSRFMDDATKKRIEAQLHSQGVSMERAMGGERVGQNVRIPFADARGYFTELGAKISGAQLPGDVFRALDHVRNVADEQITGVTKEAGQDAVYKNLKNEYKVYKQNFDDPEAAIYQFDKLDTPEKRVDFLAGGKGQNLIDSLSKYRGFGADPTIAGRVRSLVRQLRDLPSEKAMPAAPDRPKFPTGPEEKPLPTDQPLSLKAPPEAPEPLDVTRKRLEQLEHMGKTFSQFQPNQARWLRAAVAQRTIGRLLSDPAFREWVAKQGGTR